MKKKMLFRSVLGFITGITIAYLITLIISVSIGDGAFYPVPQELMTTMGSELNAVLLQTLLSGVMGAGFALASFIWDIDTWSLAKQSGVYFAIACAVMFPIAYFAHWMPHTLGGIVVYVGIFVAIFIVVWLIQYLFLKQKIKKMNEKVKRETF